MRYTQKLVVELIFPIEGENILDTNKVAREDWKSYLDCAQWKILSGSIYPQRES